MTEYEIIKTCSYCKYKNKILFEHIGKSLKCDFCDNEFQFLSIKKINGYVYVLSNNSMPGLLKIGYTERDVKTRANEISNATGVPEPYIIEAYYGLQSPQDIEKKIHTKLKDCRLPNREFFRVEIEVALNCIESICNLDPSYLNEKIHKTTKKIDNTDGLANSQIMDCVFCNTQNRIKQFSKTKKPICGNCKKELPYIE